MSETENRIARETAAEIARLEAELKSLRQFQSVIDPKGEFREKKIYRARKNPSTSAKSAPKRRRGRPPKNPAKVLVSV